MAFRVPTTPDDFTLVKRWVIREQDGPRARRYLQLTGDPQRERPGRVQFEAGLAADAHTISDDELHRLLSFEWRARLTAGWLIALDRRVRFRPEVRDLLLADELIHAGKSYCLALTRFGEPADAEILATYFDRYASGMNRGHSRSHAVGALACLDDSLGTDHSARLLDPGNRRPSAEINAEIIADSKDRMMGLCEFAEAVMTFHRNPRESVSAEITGDRLPFLRDLIAWEHTAELYTNPALVAQLSGPFRAADFVEAARPAGPHRGTG